MNSLSIPRRVLSQYGHAQWRGADSYHRNDRWLKASSLSLPPSHIPLPLPPLFLSLFLPLSLRQYIYEGVRISDLAVDLSIIWNGNFIIDNPDKIKGAFAIHHCLPWLRSGKLSLWDGWGLAHATAFTQPWENVHMALSTVLLVLANHLGYEGGLLCLPF